MNKLGLFSFIKDEESIIQSFINHHIKIFNEITIIDNGSTDGTLDILKSYSNINVINNHSDFKLKGQICSAIMKQSDCDLLIPMDADEIIVYDDMIHNKSVSRNPSKIRNYLQNLKIDGNKYQINKTYDYIPSYPNWWCCSKSTSKKMIFPQKTFMYTDCGFHRGRVTKDDNRLFDDKDQFFWRRNTSHDSITKLHNISYLHFHFQNLEFWKKNTEKKLKARLGDDWNNEKILRNYNGPSKHLPAQYLHYISGGSIDSFLSKDVYFEIAD